MGQLSDALYMIELERCEQERFMADAQDEQYAARYRWLRANVKACDYCRDHLLWTFTTPVNEAAHATLACGLDSVIDIALAKAEGRT